MICRLPSGVHMDRLRTMFINQEEEETDNMDNAVYTILAVD
jgi:hypothetical protein